MIPLFKVGMSPTAHEKVAEVLASGFIGQGLQVTLFESELWKTLQTQTMPVTVNSCTSAIDLALELLNVGPDDEVICTPQTCFASNVHVIHRKAKIRWSDIDPITGLMDPTSVEKLITKKTKAIIAVNWAGKFANYKKLKSFGIPVIEDAAHTWDVFLDRFETPIERGDYICYSLQAIKFLTSGDGGILICPDEETEQRARILRWYGLDRTKNESFRCTQNITKVGFKYHMNDINASIGLANMPVALESVKKSRENSMWYMEKLTNPLFTLPEWDDTQSYWLFSMHVPPGTKDLFIRQLAGVGITASPVHFRNDRYDSTIQFAEGDLPGVNSFTDTQVCIPNGFWLEPHDKEHIVNMLNQFTGKE